MKEPQIIQIETNRMKLNPKNPRKNDAAVDTVAMSIQKYGFKNPLIADSNLVVYCGNTRLKAARKLKLPTVPVIIADDLTPEQIREYALIDNKSGEIAEWDDDLLWQELDELDLSDFDLDWGFPENEEEKEIIEDEPPEVDEEHEPICKLGDIWQLGRHRLICGDSTDRATVERLMDGAKADMVFTDPPYNVDYSSKNAFLNEADKGNRIQKDIEGDFGYTDEECGEKLWKPAFQNMRDNAKDCCSIYVTMPQGGAHMMMMMMMIAAAGWQVKHELIWVKNNHVLGRTDYFYKHEPIMYGWSKTHKFYGKGKFDKSVWEIPKPQKSDLHPTMKPIALIANALENSSKENDIVLDLFGGSGSTLIACEQLGRRCYMMELDPRYCDVIIKRWEGLTGEKAVKVNS